MVNWNNEDVLNEHGKIHRTSRSCAVSRNHQICSAGLYTFVMVTLAANLRQSAKEAVCHKKKKKEKVL